MGTGWAPIQGSSSWKGDPIHPNHIRKRAIGYKPIDWVLRMTVAVRHVVGIAEMKIGTQEDVLVTYALGSCLGIVIYDPVAKVAGLLHVMLPLSTTNPEKAAQRPCMFVDTGLPMLFLEAYKAGAKKERLLVKAAGGASFRGNLNHTFEIGRRNIVMLRKMLWRNGVLLKAEDLGGYKPRTVSVEVATGQVTLSSNGKKREL